MEAAVVERLRRGGRVRLHPRLVHAALPYDEDGRRELRAIYRSYLEVARRAGLPMLLCTPTWRANRERVIEADLPGDPNRNAVDLLERMRADHLPGAPEVRIGGLIGCKNDCYRPEEGLTTEEAEEFHAWQIGSLAEAGSDFLIAETLPAVPEAVGIARAMAATGVPYIVSFVIDRRGAVLDGTSLVEAIDLVDQSVPRPPLGFMVNCAHPSFLNAAHRPRRLFARLVGYQANASALDHADLDGLDRLDAGDVADWGASMLDLNRTHGVKILGGCCGTGVEHLEYLAGNR